MIPDTATSADGWGEALVFSPMSVEAARVIADGWKYPAPYDFYDATADAEDHEEFVTPSRWPELFWQVRHGEDLVGFFTADANSTGAYEISLGLRPDLTGGGRGLSFLRAGLQRVESAAPGRRVVLSVAAFNRRAIKVYEAAGFRITGHHEQPTNGSTFDFVDMELCRESACAR